MEGNGKKIKVEDGYEGTTTTKQSKKDKDIDCEKSGKSYLDGELHLNCKTVDFLVK